jgi:integrase
VNLKGKYEGIAWLAFERAPRPGRRREIVVKYQLAEGATWKPLQAPSHVTNETKLRLWVREKLEELRALGEQPTRGHSRGGSTVGELFERWIDLRENDPSVAGATAEGNRSDFRARVLPTFGSTPLLELESRAGLQRLREWARALAGEVSATRCRNVVSSFTTFVRDVKLEGWAPLRTNPLESDEVTTVLPVVGKRKTIVYLDLVVAQALVDGHRANPDAPAAELRHRVRYMLALCTGAADGEIAGLKVGDVRELDTARARIEITKAFKIRGKLREDGKRGAQLGGPKNEYRIRAVPLNAAARAALTEWLESGWEAWVGEPPTAGAALFPDDQGEHSRPRMADYLRADLEAAGLPTTTSDGRPYEFRALRRTFSTMLSAEKVPRETRERLMGQRSDSVNTEHYTGLVADELSDAVSKLRFRWHHGGPVVAGHGGGGCGDVTSSEPPSRLELETYGLRKHTQSGSDAEDSGTIGSPLPHGADVALCKEEKRGLPPRIEGVEDAPLDLIEAVAEHTERATAFVLAAKPVSKARDEVEQVSASESGGRHG